MAPVKLQSLHLRNFQKHKRLDISFAPDVTVIVGRSDVGKSAIVRALSLVLRNKPSGTDFISHGEDKATVILKTNVGKVKRVRGNRTNTYHLNKSEFKAFGSETPKPITDLLKIGDLNFQDQHDAAFWFSESSMSVSRKLNAIVNLDVIDDVLRKAQTSLSDSRQASIIMRRRITEFSEIEMNTLSAKEAKKELSSIIKLYKKISRLKKQSSNLSETIDDAISLERRAIKIEEMMRDFEPIEKHIQTKQLTKRLEVALLTISGIEKKDTDDSLFPDFTAFSDAYADYLHIKEDLDRKRRIEYAIREYERALQIEATAEAELEEQQKTFDKLTKGKMCPVCKGPLNHSHV